MTSSRRVLVALVLAALAGCGAPEPTGYVISEGDSNWTPSSSPATSRPQSSTRPSTKRVKITVVLDLAVSVKDDGSISVHVESNLPDGTELGGSIVGEGGFTAREAQVLRSGTADFGPFTGEGSPIPSGSYDVSVTMPPAHLQPESVRAVIGEHGELLIGPLVKRVDGNATVSMTKSLAIR